MKYLIILFLLFSTTLTAQVSAIAAKDCIKVTNHDFEYDAGIQYGYELVWVENGEIVERFIVDEVREGKYTMIFPIADFSLSAYKLVRIVEISIHPQLTISYKNKPIEIEISALVKN